jgi:hypothetical protein
MNDDRFDAITRFIGSRASRRLVAGLAATGLLSVAVPEAAARGCSAARPCPACKRCKRHRCKPDRSKNGTACLGGICHDGKCRCTDPRTHRCPGTGVCGECCAIGDCPEGEFCQNELGGPFLCYCGFTTVDCQQVCIPRSCEAQCAKSCSGPEADCGCDGHLSCQAEAPGVYFCLPTG